jgi:hypothetical protein
MRVSIWKFFSGGKLDPRPEDALQAFTCQFVRGIRFTAHVTDDPISAPAALANLVNSVSECFA